MFQGRTPIDLLSEELKGFLEHEAAGNVFSWGNGSNYQLGTGTAGLQSGPVRLDGLRKELIVQIAAAKFHSAAVTRDGRLFTWGFGRGGRLGVYPYIPLAPYALLQGHSFSWLCYCLCPVSQCYTCTHCQCSS